MRAAWKTDRGLVRSNNEDSLLADEGNGIFLLADGMGGGPAGEVASALAVRASHELLVLELQGAAEGADRRVLADALAAAHSAVAKRALSDTTLRGMGTTLEIVVVQGREASVCHVGDSRVYLYRDGRLRQLTNDDNYAGVLARDNVPPENIPAAYRHMLTQVVGISEELVPEVLHLALAAGDILLVCSDGLNGVVSDREIQIVLAENRFNLEAIAERLVAMANEKGGPDNISVIVIEPLWNASSDSLLLPAS